MSYATKFSTAIGAASFPPTNGQTDLLEKAYSDTPLTRDEKNRIATILYGVCGSHSSQYRLAGWVWHLADARQIQRILVSYTYERGTFRAYYAPDKTSLRHALDDSNIAEMIYAPRKGR